MVADLIKKTVQDIISKEFSLAVDFVVEHPKEESHGDYSTNIALILFKKIPNTKYQIPNTKTLAQKIVEELKKDSGLGKIVKKIEAVKPGFINFWLSEDYLFTQLEQIQKEKDNFGRAGVLKGKKIIVEFAHPNTHKPFHIGHLRNICFGEALVRILEANGSAVIRVNYQGDVGLHIAKCLWAIQKSKINIQKLKTLNERIEFLGKKYVQGNKVYEENKRAKEEIELINKHIYSKDPKIMPLWTKTRKWSLDYFDRIYKRVYTTFDRFYFESEVADAGKKIVLNALKKGIFEKSQGAIIFDGEKYGFHKRVFINQLGFPIYEAKDMELGRLQFFEFSPDLIIHVVGPEQKGYFEVVFRALAEIFPKTKGKERHLMYGWVKLKKGKMSSRAGQVVLGEWLLDEVKRRLLVDFKMDDKVAEIVSVAASKYSLLKISPESEIVFDIDESISLDGNSGPYLQYTYARCRSVLRKAEVIPDHRPFSISDRINMNKINTEELVILRTLYKFPEVVLEAGQNYTPNLICNFLFDLAQKYNLFYNKHRIVNANTEKQRNFRLGITVAIAQILKNGLNFLGIKVLERM